jgi:hypothetical protein
MTVISKEFDRERSWPYFQVLLGIRLEEPRENHENNKPRHPVPGAGVLTGDFQIQILTLSH